MSDIKKTIITTYENEDDKKVEIKEISVSSFNSEDRNDTWIYEKLNTKIDYMYKSTCFWGLLKKTVKN